VTVPQQTPTNLIGDAYPDSAGGKAGRFEIFNLRIDKGQAKMPVLTLLKCPFHAACQLRSCCSPAPRVSNEWKSSRLGAGAKGSKKRVSTSGKPLPKVKICTIIWNMKAI
jgi:hypothetical protein